VGYELAPRLQFHEADQAPSNPVCSMTPTWGVITPLTHQAPRADVLAARPGSAGYFE
jgi:hypothetical protein